MEELCRQRLISAEPTSPQTWRQQIQPAAADPTCVRTHQRTQLSEPIQNTYTDLSHVKGTSNAEEIGPSLKM